MHVLHFFNHSTVFLPSVPAKVTSFGGLVLRPWRSSVSLTCHVVGVPLPRREWLRDERPLQASHNHNTQIMESGELVVSGLQRADSDNYTCRVENNLGSDSIHYTLVVQGNVHLMFTKQIIAFYY